ncbi:MAG: insulinase family protein, partial [Candidatus Dadabacteria bacterium]
MNKRLFAKLSVVILLSFFFIFTTCSTSNRKEIKKIFKRRSFLKPSEVKYEKWSLKNGLTVYYSYDGELPLVEGWLLIKGGLMNQPKEKIGLASALQYTLRYGGAGKYSPTAFENKLSDIGASLSVKINTEYSTLSFSSLAKDFKTALSLAYLAAAKPSFSYNTLEVWRKKQIANIQRRKNNPYTIALLSFYRAVYRDSVWANIPTLNSINKIKRIDLVRFHRTLFNPANSVLVVTGRIEAKKLKEELNDTFTKWQKRIYAPSSVPSVPKPLSSGIYFFKGDFKQATVIAGSQSISRKMPVKRKVEIDLFNTVVGADSFVSILGEKIRSEMGAAYWIYGSVSPGRVKGVNIVAFQTGANRFKESFTASLTLLKEAIEGKDLEPKRLAIARNILRNRFIFNYTTPMAVLQRRVMLKFFGYPKDYDNQYLKLLQKEDFSPQA